MVGASSKHMQCVFISQMLNPNLKKNSSLSLHDFVVYPQSFSVFDDFSFFHFDELEIVSFFQFSVFQSLRDLIH